MMFAKQLEIINDLAIDRRIVLNNTCHIEIHGFCDANQNGYGACIYVRSIDSLGCICVRLLCAKSRVAPIKQSTIPRLELCAAWTLAKLYKTIASSLRFKLVKLCFDQIPLSYSTG